MSYGNFEVRSKSFKKNRHKIKWRHKALSMVGMARSFYEFDPLPNAKDRVLCAVCKAEFTDWRAIKTNPIERHADVNEHCFVSKLASLHSKISSGNSISKDDIREACLPTFYGAIIEDTSSHSAENGFYYMENKSNDSETLACLSCLCFPQSFKKPQHSTKCLLAHILESAPQSQEGIKVLETSVKQTLEKDTRIIFRDKLSTIHRAIRSQSVDDLNSTTSSPVSELARPATAVAHPDSLCKLSRQSFNQPTVDKSSESKGQSVDQRCSSKSNFCEMSLQPKDGEAVSLHQETSCNALLTPNKIPAFQLVRSIHKDANEYISQIFSSMMDKEEIKRVEYLELSVFETIECAHAKQVSIIRSETERIIQDIIKCAGLPC